MEDTKKERMMKMKISGKRIINLEKEDIEISDEDFLKQVKSVLDLSDECHLNKDETELGYWIDTSYDYSNFEHWEWRCISKDKEKIEQYKRNKLAYDIIENNLERQLIEKEWDRLGTKIINYLKLEKFDYDRDKIELERSDYELTKFENGENWITNKKFRNYFIEQFQKEGYLAEWDDYHRKVIIQFKKTITINKN